MLPDSLDSDSDDEQQILSSPKAATLRATAAACRAAQLERQLFTSPHFAVFPPEGTVHPNSQFEVIVQFQPDFAAVFEETAYVEVQGRETRLPITLTGKGLGPTVVFPYDSVDIGDVYIHTSREYSLELQNRGKIDAEFTLQLPDTPAMAQWELSPAAGTLAGGETLIVRALLRAAVLGEFEEVLGCAIKGSSKVLELRLRGRVAGPSFEVDCRELDLGTVGCGFRWGGGQGWAGAEPLCVLVLRTSHNATLFEHPMCEQHELMQRQRVSHALAMSMQMPALGPMAFWDGW